MAEKKAVKKKTAAKKAPKNRKGKIYKDTLKCTLTKTERALYAEELAQDSIDLRETGEKKKEIAATFAADEKKLEANIGVLSRKVNTGEEWRGVDVQWTYNFKSGKKTKVRLDTGEWLKTEDVTTEDRQSRLKFVT